MSPESELAQEVKRMVDTVVETHLSTINGLEKIITRLETKDDDQIDLSILHLQELVMILHEFANSYDTITNSYESMVKTKH